MSCIAPNYKCKNTFTSYTKNKTYSCGNTITSNEYHSLALSEQMNFVEDTDSSDSYSRSRNDSNDDNYFTPSILPDVFDSSSPAQDSGSDFGGFGGGDFGGGGASGDF